MEWSQVLFQKTVRLFRSYRAKKRQESVGLGNVELQPIRDRLTILARMLTGTAIEIIPTHNEGGYSGNTFFLPQNVSFSSQFESNLNFFTTGGIAEHLTNKALAC